MLVIRLTRIGKKNQPSYRVVLTEKTNPVRGKFIEILGSYNPREKTKALKAERIQYWISKGAQTSPTVHNLLVNEKIINGPKVRAWHPKKKTQDAKMATDAKTEEAVVPVEEIKTDDVKMEASAKEAKVGISAEEEVKTEAPAEETRASE